MKNFLKITYPLCVTFLIFFLVTSGAYAAQNDVFLAKMKVVRQISLGSTYDYEVETSRGGRAILKTPPFQMKIGENVNFFVKEGAPENGKPAYIVLTTSSPRSLAGGFSMVKLGGFWTYMDKNGSLLVKGGFDKAFDFSGGFGLVLLKNSWAFLNTKGEFLESPMISPFDEYESIDSGMFKDSRVGVRARTKNNSSVPILLDDKGDVIQQLGQEASLYIKNYSEGLAAIRGNSRVFGDRYVHAYGFMDKSGKIVIPSKFEWAGNFKSGLAPVHTMREDGSYTNKYGYIDRSGKLLIDAVYERANDFSEDRAAVQSGGSWGFIDTKGKTIANPVYQEVRPFHGGLSAVKIGGKWGYINQEGQLVIKAIYGQAKDFSDGLAPVAEKEWGSLWGYIDIRGHFVVKPQYKQAESHSAGLALVRDEAPGSGDKWKYINTKGQAALWFYAYN